MNKPLDLLLVDNEQESIETRLKWLREDGYRPFPLSTLSGAWQYIIDYKEDHSERLPLVLLDIMMPTVSDLDWLTDYEKNNKHITAPTAGLEFAEKLKDTYPNIVIAWHSVRHKGEPAVAQKIKKLGFGLVQKDLQNKTEFLKEVGMAFKI